MNHSHLKRAETIGRINSCFKDVENLTTPVLTKEQFEKSLSEGDKFYENSTIHDYLTELQKSMDSDPDKKDDIMKSATEDLGTLKKIIVVEGSSKKIVWVKKAQSTEI